MSTISLPSKKIVIVDIPEVINFNGKFVYNFFTPDERTTTPKKSLPDFIKNRFLEDQGNEFIESNNFNRFSPRYVRLTWTPKNSPSSPSTKFLIKDNLDNLYSETSFTLDGFSSLTFQDSNFSNKLDFFIGRMLEETKNQQQNAGRNKNTSLLDDVKFLKRRTSNIIQDGYLASAHVRYKNNGQLFKNRTTGEEQFVKTDIDKLDQIKSRVQLNNKVIRKAVATISESTMYMYDEGFSSFLDEVEQIQNDSITKNPSSLISAEEYDIDIANAIDIRPVDVSGFKPEQYVIGYVIRKTEITEDGTVVEHDPIIIESSSVGTIADLEVRYGVTYNYTIETVSLLTAQVVDTENKQVAVATFMASSKPTPVVSIDCNEYIPPEAPHDFTIKWDHRKGFPRLSWAFPVNVQQDVKYFQVFRRKAVTEPFELIKMYSFDDSLIKSELNETPDDSLIETLSSPTTMFIDTEFKSGDSWIYAVCCVDAHGFSSNYSIQYRVWFNKFENKLKMELVSRSGAPKAYPNMFLNQDMFVDTIKDSGHKEVKVYFMPEYLEVHDSNGTDLGLLTKKDKKSKFQLQMINVDLQEQKSFDVFIQDLRNLNGARE